MTMLQSNPSISIVIASGAGGDFLPRCLDSLREQAAAEGAEVIVVDRCGGEFADRIRRDYPFATIIPAMDEPRASVPELRKIGAIRARADVVAIIEEHCVAPPTWLATIREAVRPDDAAISGPILDNNFTRIRDWVVYFSEYNNYLPPWPDGERSTLSGANIAYRRDLLVKHQDVLGTGYWEVVLHPLLAQDGKLRAVSAMGIRHTGPFDYLYYLEQRYLLSRVWGGTQKDRVSPLKRFVYLVAAPAFPPLLLARTVGSSRPSP
jgi:glycosyltransferase involved in cell wall biosynthesis